MNDIAFYTICKNIHSMDVAIGNIASTIRKQGRFNKRVAIFSAAITAFSIISRNRIVENRIRIRKLEKQIEELKVQIETKE